MSKKPYNPFQTLMRVMSYMAKNKLQLFLVIFLVLLCSGAQVAGNYYLKPIINDYIAPMIGVAKENRVYDGLIFILTQLVIIYIVGVLSGYAYKYIMMNLSNRALNEMRKDLFNKMQDLPIKYYDTHQHGDIMSCYTNDIDTIREAMSEGFTAVVSSVVSIVGNFTMMLMLSPFLTLFIIAMSCLMVLIVKKFGSLSSRYFKKQQKSMGRVNGYVEEMFEGVKVVKVFNHEEKVCEEFEQLNNELRDAAIEANTYASIIMPIMGNLSYVTYALFASLGAFQVINGMLDIGSLASFLQYTRSFSMPITNLSQQFNAIFRALAGAERIFALIDEKSEVNDGKVTLVNVKEENGVLTECEERTGHWAWKHPHGDTFELVPLQGDVRFNDVVFGYEENKVILKHINLFAKPGQKIAFVGSTGAGKTTITNLINRFYDVSHGQITYDGIDIKLIRKEDLRRSLAMVLQDTHLFTTTVRENIRYGKLDATDEEVVAAAKLANADTFIRHLPQGYDTPVGELGDTLSGGERQRIGLARAFLHNAPFLLLDEPTSNLDSLNEGIILRALREEQDERTVILVSHRHSTLSIAHRTYTVDCGRLC